MANLTVKMGQITISSDGNGRSRSWDQARLRASGRSLRGRMTAGMRSWIVPTSSFAGVVSTEGAFLRGSFRFSQIPAMPKCDWSFRAIA